MADQNSATDRRDVAAASVHCIDAIAELVKAAERDVKSRARRRSVIQEFTRTRRHEDSPVYQSPPRLSLWSRIRRRFARLASA